MMIKKYLSRQSVFLAFAQTETNQTKIQFLASISIKTKQHFGLSRSEFFFQKTSQCRYLFVDFRYSLTNPLLNRNA